MDSVNTQLAKESAYCERYIADCRSSQIKSEAQARIADAVADAIAKIVGVLTENVKAGKDLSYNQTILFLALCKDNTNVFINELFNKLVSGSQFEALIKIETEDKTDTENKIDV